MKIEDVQHCSFQNWYDKFKKFTIKSIILPLPEGFPQYILKDGIVLPQSSNSYFVEANSSDESDTEVDWENSNSEEAQAPHFPDFDEKIKDAISSLGGKVFPKLNWSSPRDATWIAFNNSCCCTSVSDIYLLLKSSDFIVHDLTKAFQHCEDYIADDKVDNLLSQPSEEFYLVLRKWVEIDPSGEFRCFVKNNKLIGVCQREDSLFFDHIDTQKRSILIDIVSFFKENIQFKFYSSNFMEELLIEILIQQNVNISRLNKDVFDVYRRKKENVQLLDFNPFGDVTDSLLFSWTELLDGSLSVQDSDFPVFHFVNENYGVQPRPLGYYAIPKDVVDISTGEDSFKLVDLMKLKIEEQTKELSSDDEVG